MSYHEEELKPNNMIIANETFDTPTKCQEGSSDAQNLTPQLPTAPQSSPVDFSEQTFDSKMNENFKSKFLKACMAKLPQIRMPKSSIDDEIMEGLSDHNEGVNLSVRTKSCTWNRQEELNMAVLGDESGDKVMYSSLLSVASTMSTSDLDLSGRSPCSDEASMAVHAGSDASGLSTDSLSEDEIFNRLTVEKSDFDLKTRSDFKTFKSPSFSLKSVLNWRKCVEENRRRTGSVDDIHHLDAGGSIKFPRTQFELSV